METVGLSPKDLGLCHSRSGHARDRAPVVHRAVQAFGPIGNALFEGLVVPNSKFHIAEKREILFETLFDNK